MNFSLSLSRLDKNAVEDLWASFNDTADDPYAASTSTSTSNSTSTLNPTISTSSSVAPSSKTVNGKGKGKATLDLDDLVTIKVTYKFAGDTVTYVSLPSLPFPSLSLAYPVARIIHTLCIDMRRQDKKVPRNSQEAQNYFALHPSEKPSTSNSTPSLVKPDPTTSSLDALFGPDSSSITPASNSEPPLDADTSKSASPAPPPVPAPAAGRKKKAGGLGAMAASLGVGGKPAKLNTLEKSKLDWNSYVSFLPAFVRSR